MSSKGFLIAVVSAGLMLGVPAWAGDHDGDEPHGHGHEYHEHENHGHEMHGKKRGWRGCNLPPGQAKKYGCGVPVHAVPPPPPPPPPTRVMVVAPPPPPPPSRVIVVAPLPPPPAAGVQVHVEAVIHP